MARYSLLVIEDNDEIRENIRILLNGDEYEIVEADSGEAGLELFSEETDLVILDIMLPGISGLRVCEEIRKNSNVPILFLTAKSQEQDKLIGFMAGGDDYLPKPFSYTELMARIKALIRRYYIYKGKEPEAAPEHYIERGQLKLNIEFNEVLADNNPVKLSDIEYNILRIMMQNEGKIFSTKNIYESVWNEPYFYVSNNTVMVHIRNLRTKIEKNPQNPEYIHTVWGKGYKFSADNK